MRIYELAQILDKYAALGKDLQEKFKNEVMNDNLDAVDPKDLETICQFVESTIDIIGEHKIEEELNQDTIELQNKIRMHLEYKEYLKEQEKKS